MPEQSTNPRSTTIAIDVECAKMLNAMKTRSSETYNEVVRRLIGIGDDEYEIYMEFILVDNEYPRLHTAVFQLGENKDKLFFFNGYQSNPISTGEVAALMKKPKPTFLLSRTEAELVYKHLANKTILPSLPSAFKVLLKRLESHVWVDSLGQKQT